MVKALTLTREDWDNSATWIDDDCPDIGAYLSGLKKSELPAYDLGQKLAQWHEDGIVIFEGVVDSELVDKVRSDFDFVLRNHDKYHIGIDGSNELAEKYGYLDRLGGEQVREMKVRLCDFHTISYNAARLSMVPEGISFLQHVFRSQPALLQTLTFPVGSQQPLHQDFAYVFRHAELAKLAAFWIPLEDIHPDSGPLEYYPGSHRVGKVGFFDWGNGAINQFDRYNNKGKSGAYYRFLEERITELKLTPRYFLPRKGDLLIWHGALIHAGSKIKNPSLTRKSLVGHYTTLSSHHWLNRHRLEGGVVFNRPEHTSIAAYRSDHGASSILGRVKGFVRKILT